MEEVSNRLRYELDIVSTEIRSRVQEVRQVATTLKGIAQQPQSASSVKRLQDNYSGSTSSLTRRLSGLSMSVLQHRYLEVLIDMVNTPAILGTGIDLSRSNISALCRLDGSTNLRFVNTWMSRCRDSLPGLTNNVALLNAATGMVSNGSRIRLQFASYEETPSERVIHRYLQYVNSKLSCCSITHDQGASYHISIRSFNGHSQPSDLAESFLGLAAPPVLGQDTRLAGQVHPLLLRDACVLSNFYIAMGRYLNARMS